ncbi:MAG TPA: N-formylglutamate amidohydrolase [Azospirillum sp.]|nr:N-formylglutamate amidohydrolase [Azospirillum sp.]
MSMRSPCQPTEYETPVTGPLPSRPEPPPPLLGPGEPPAVRVLNSDGSAPFLLVCDHASCAIPRELGTLGLPPEQLVRHIAWDIGVAELTQLLSSRFDAPAVLSGYSRLVIDPNRALEDPTLIPVVSDGVVVPGNRALDAEGVRRRVDALYRPYHDTIATMIASLCDRDDQGWVVPAIVSIHSFTPVMRGAARPWHVGVLWDRDPRIPLPLIERLRADGRWVVGDNEPYSGRNTLGGTIEAHATPAGLPNVLIEVRQDLIEDSEGVARWAQVLGDALAPILAPPSLYRIEHHPRN